MSKPFCKVAPESVEVALLGGKESAVHVGVHEVRQVLVAAWAETWESVMAWMINKSARVVERKRPGS